MNTIYIYTDGSSTPVKGGGKAQGGWGFVATLNPKSKDIITTANGYDALTTNNGMELTAVINSLHYTYKNLSNYKKVTILTDSRYVSDTIYFNWVSTWKDNGWVNSQGKETKNVNKWIELTNLIANHKRRGVEVEIRWVRGHNGNHFNEIADKLAKTGKRSKQINKKYI